MSQNDTMIYNFKILKERTLNTLSSTKSIKQLKNIKGPTLCIGSGGSNVVATFAALILNTKNSCPTKSCEPRDVLYENLTSYKNLFVCSYSGNNHGINVLSNLKTKKYLLTYGEDTDKNFKKIKCSSSLPKEMSFISLGATLMPMSILLSYYLNKNCSSLVDELITKASIKSFNIKDCNLPYDVISGQDTITAEKYLDSTFAESGLGSLVIHKKYDFCHGRSTLAYTEKRNLIYLVANRKELDELLLNLLKDKYQNITILESNYNDIVLDNFNLTIQAMYLTKALSELKNIDLSIVSYDKQLCKILYKYKGAM
jgi:hypothetical protein